MAALFASGAVIDLILAAVAAEALVLTLLCRRSGRGPDPRGLLINLGSGAALMLALRAALTGQPWPAVAGWMLAGLACHLADLALRFRGTRRHAAAGGGPPQEHHGAPDVPAVRLERL